LVFSTNEELQATLQELSDLQDQLTDLQVEVETLNNEKRVIFDSLYSQTEKLEDCRQQNNNLKQLLFTKAQDPSFCQSDREQRLLDLIRAAQEEKELLLLKQEDLQAQVALARDAQNEAQRESALLRDR
jgi:septal ring factor EnvC (AmiA/AmiB activator)